MKKVVLESPFAGNIERNVAYAKLCIRDMLLRGEAPIASHLLFTQPGLLDDNNVEQRKLGIEAGHAWIVVSDFVAAYQDFGISKGMEAGLKRAWENYITVEYRNLSESQIQELKLKYPEENNK